MAVDFHWQVQHAKQRLSEVLRAAEQEGPQFVSRHGRDVAVVLGIDDYQRLVRREHGSFREALRAMPTVEDGDVFDVDRRAPARTSDQGIG